MCSSGATGLWHALIRTHHITSRKKVAKLKQAAAVHDVYVLLRSGSPPGIMYVQGTKSGVEEWVGTVHRLRYKDFQLAARPATMELEVKALEDIIQARGLFELDSVKSFAVQMEQRGLLDWWRRAMGYAGNQGRV